MAAPFIYMKKGANSSNMDELYPWDSIAYIRGREEDVPWETKVLPFIKSKNGETLSSFKKIQDRYITSLKTANVNMVKKTSAGELESLMETDDKLLVSLMDEFAKQANEQITQLQQSNINAFQASNITARNKAKVFENLKNISIDNKDVNDFFDSIYNALKAVENISFKDEDWNDFKVALLKTTSRNLGEVNSGIVNLANGNEQVERVLKYLKNIFFTSKGNRRAGYSATQMTGTLNNIFGTTLGEAFGQIEWDMLNKVDNMVVQKFNNANKTRLAGTATPSFQDGAFVTSNTAKVDLINSNGLTFDLKLENSGDVYKLTGELNSSIKWYSDLEKKDNKGKTISIFDSSRGADYLAQVYGTTAQAQNSYLNTIAFSNSKNSSQNEAYRLIRGALIARYMEVFIAGSGAQLKSKDNIIGTDISSFLLINGKLYPIAGILVSYLDMVQNEQNILFQGGDQSLVKLNLAFNNKWIGNEKPNALYAGHRSKKGYIAFNKIKMSAHLNVNVLNNIIKSRGIKPLI